MKSGVRFSGTISVAELLRVSRQAVYRAINDGELPAIRSRKLVLEPAVTAVLRRATTAGGTSPNTQNSEETLAPTAENVTG